MTPLFQITALVFILFVSTGLVKAERLAKIIYRAAPAEAPDHAYIYQNDESAQKVPLGSRKFSASFKLHKGEQKLSFFSAALPKGSVSPKNPPQVIIPAEWKNVILVVYEDPENTVMPIRVRAFDASEKSFPEGGLLFINDSDSIISGTVHKTAVNIEGKETEMIDSPLKERGTFNLLLDSSHPKTEEKRNLLRKRWLHNPKFRNVIFIEELVSGTTVKAYVAEIRSF